jgi:hypothetical protein
VPGVQKRRYWKTFVQLFEVLAGKLQRDVDIELRPELREIRLSLIHRPAGAGLFRSAFHQEIAYPCGRIKKVDWTAIVIIGALIGWVVLHRWILPKMGVPT